MSSRPSRSDITQPLSRLVWKVPSFSLRQLKAGLVSARSCCWMARAVIGALAFHRRLDGRDAAAGLRRRDDLRLARGEPVERRLHGVDFVDRHDDRPVAVALPKFAPLAPHPVPPPLPTQSTPPQEPPEPTCAASRSSITMMLGRGEAAT